MDAEQARVVMVAYLPHLQATIGKQHSMVDAVESAIQHLAEVARLRDEVAALTTIATARGMKANDLGQLANGLNRMIDGLEAEVAALKANNRWAAFTDEGLAVLEDAIYPRYAREPARATQFQAEITEELARREVRDE